MPRQKKNQRLLSELKAHKFFCTVEACNYWFSIINDEVFSNRLEPVTIEVRKLRGAWGLYYHEGLLVLNDVFHSKNLFLNVLSHEMIHAYQHQKGLEINHGKTFWLWRKKFASNGLSLAIKYD
jgi:predicted SprT family Zn-dependent metalloprotease